jgi:Flp pilus assembly protein TadB
METHPEGGTVIPWPGPTREQESDQAPEPECELVPAAELVAAFTVALREEIERQQRRRAAGVKALLLACLAGLLGGPVVLALLAALIPELRSIALGVALVLGVPSLLMWRRSRELHQRARMS